VELGPLALRYVPFIALLGAATVVTLDARVRVKRPGRARWSAPMQLLLALAMLVLATVAIVVSPEVGLVGAAERSAATLGGTLCAFAAAGAFALLTLLCGLAWPATPHPRRGLTLWALVVDALAVAMTALHAAG
jgi:drug/metabolite transporter (DMT)-like permease